MFLFFRLSVFFLLVSPSVYAYELSVVNKTVDNFPVVLVQEGYGSPYRGAPLKAEATQTYVFNQQKFVMNFKGESGFNVGLMRKEAGDKLICRASAVYQCVITGVNSVVIKSRL